MSVENVREYLKKYGADTRIMEFDTSSATVALAAEALGCAPGRIAKTLSFVLSKGCILIVAAGDVRVDNKKFKAFFGEKAKMPSPDDAETLIGHRVGGICPFAVNDGVEVFLDVSLKNFETVFPACGSSNSAIELTLSELEEFSGFRGWIDVCKEAPAAL